MTTNFLKDASNGHATPAGVAQTRKSANRLTLGGCNFALSLLLTLAASNPAVAGPEGGQVVGGDATIDQNGRLTQIFQGSDRVAINWDTFNVGLDETVRFIQPSSTSVALNHIFDQNASQIFGAIDANGVIFLINPNGLVFGANAQVNVASLIASSLNISTADFMAGNYTFEAAAGAEGGLVLNQGNIVAAEGGFVALLGQAVANEGLIVANAGTISLASGNKVALDFDGGGLLFFEVQSDVLQSALGQDSAVSNSGSLVANGGQVLLTARAAQDVFTNAINNEGLIQAQRIDNQGGVVRLIGNSGTVVSTGSIDASGGDAVSTGGTVELLGNRVGLLGSGSIDASGDTGGGTVLIGGDAHGAGDLTSEFTQVAADASISADARVDGDGGKVIVWADNSTWFNGSASVTGGSTGGDGGFVEISGAQGLSYAGNVDATAANGALGTLLFDPTDITVTDQADGAGANDGELPDLSNTTAGAGTFVISETALEAQAASADIILEATNNITINSLADGELNLATNPAGSVTFSADTDNTGGGAFSMDTADTISTAGGNITINGPATVGSLVSNNGDVTITSNAGLSVASINAGNGNVSLQVDADNNSAETLALGGAITSSGTVSLAGGTDSNDTLQGANSTNAWAISTATTGTLNGQGYSNFANLTGGSQADNFVFADGASLAGTVAGGAGTDTVDVSAHLAATDAALNTTLTGVNATNGFAGTVATGGAGDITDFTGINALVGSADAGVTDTLTGQNAASFVAVNGAGSGVYDDDTGTTTAALAFSNVDNLVGGNQADQFTLNAGGAVGSISGGGGTDTLIATDVAGNNFLVTATGVGNVNGATTFSSVENLTGGAGNDVFAIDSVTAVGTFDGAGGSDTQTYAGAGAGTPLTVSVASLLNMETVIGTGNAGDTLQGTTGADAFVTSGADAGTVNTTLAYSGFENLAGLGNNDTFALSHAVTGTVDGGAGNDTITLNAGGSAASIIGGTETDTIIATNVAGNTFAVSATGVGTVNGGNAFTGVENLTGGAGNDIFAINSVTAVGTFDGAGGNDTQTYAGAGAGTPLTVSVASLVNMETVIGTGNAGDTLQGTTGADAFVTSGANAGTVNTTLAYSSFENLAGLGNNDTFALSHAVSGTVDGGTGDDTITLNAGGSAATIIGGANTDTIVGLAAGNAFVVNAADAGTVNGGAFNTVENLTGGAGVDTFALSGALSGNASGAAGNDTFTLNGGSAGTIAGGADTDTIVGNATANAFVVNATNAGTVNGGAFNTVENLTGGAAGDTFALNAALSGAASGAGGDDTFTLNGGSAGTIAGGADTDTIVGNGTANAFVVSAADAGTVNGGAFNTVENLTGGAAGDTFALNAGLSGNASGAGGDDTFTLNGGSAGTIVGGADTDTIVGNGTANAFVVSAADAGTVNGGAFNTVENLTGGAAGDTFALNAGLSGNASGAGGDDTFTLNGGSAGTIVGGAGTGDTILGTAAANTFVVNAADAGTVNGGAFNTVENLTGGAAGDTFALNAALSGNASGAGGDDTFTLDGGSAGTIVGGADTDTIVGNGTANAFVVSAANAGTVNGGAFNTVENLTGGAAGDTFALNAALSGNASGAGGDDTFTLNGGSAGTIVGGAGTGDTIVGTAAANTFVVNAADAGTVNGGAFNTVENLTGGGSADNFTLTGALSGTASGAAGNDTFNVNNGGSAGTFDGGADIDTQTYAANTTGTVVVDFSNSVNVENFVGSANDDTFNMNTDIANGLTVNGGGGANDAFVVTAASNISGDLTVTNVDTVDVDASLSAQNVDIDSSGNIVINSDLDATDVLTLTSGGSITQIADTGIVTAQSLDASSVTGQTFTNTTVAMYNAINTGSGGIEIHNDGDLTLDLLCAGSGAGCQPGTEAGTGPVIVEATGNLYAVGGQTNIIGNSASLFAGGQMGTPSVPITFRGFPETGIPIDIHVSSTAIVPYIDAYAASSATADYAGGTGGAVAIENVKISQKAAASAALAAAIKEDTDVDWAAYSEDITVYEISNEGVQLPAQQQFDEFSKLDNEEELVPLASNLQH